MRRIRLFINYKTTDKPWGGSNSFLSALRSYLSESADFELVSGENEDFDLMLLNTAYTAPGEYVSLRKVRSYQRFGHAGFLRYCLGGLKKKAVKTIVRLDGLRRFYAGTPNIEGDEIQLALVDLVDTIIFQSKESMRQFERVKGDILKQCFVIHNGVNQSIFNTDGKTFWNGKGRINVFTTSWSTNPRKGFEDMVRLSELEGIVLNYVGNWPDEIKHGKIILKPPMSQALLAEEYKKNHVFFFPSRNEACPNVVLEALSCGLPVIYHPSGGTPEITSGYGVEMKDDLRSSLSAITDNYEAYVEKIVRDHFQFSISHAGRRYAEVLREVFHHV